MNVVYYFSVPVIITLNDISEVFKLVYFSKNQSPSTANTSWSFPNKYYFIPSVHVME